MKLEIFALLCLSSSVLCQLNELNCYDCSPGDSNKCLSPDESNIKTTNCQETFERSLTTSATGQNSPASEPECFILFLNNTGGVFPIGTYRGCIWKNTGETACDELKRRYGQLADCRSCPRDRCNTENLMRSADVPDGAAAVTLSAILLVNVLLFVRFL